MPKASVKYEIGLYERLQDPQYALEYLNACLEGGDEEGVLLALRDIAEARSISRIAKDAGLNRESLYKMLSGSVDPKLSSILKLVASLGFTLRIGTRATASRVTATKRRTKS